MKRNEGAINTFLADAKVTIYAFQSVTCTGIKEIRCGLAMWKTVLPLVLLGFAGAYDKFQVVRYEERDFLEDPKKYGHEPWRFVRFGYGIGYGVKDPGIAYESGYGFVRGLGSDICPDHPEKCEADGRYKRKFHYIGRHEPYFGWRPRGTAAADIKKDPYRKANLIANHYFQGPH